MCTEDNVDVHDIELMQYINVDCSKLKRLLQGELLMSSYQWDPVYFSGVLCILASGLMYSLFCSRNGAEVSSSKEAGPACSHQQLREGSDSTTLQCCHVWDHPLKWKLLCVCRPFGTGWRIIQMSSPCSTSDLRLIWQVGAD